MITMLCFSNLFIMVMFGFSKERGAKLPLGRGGNFYLEPALVSLLPVLCFALRFRETWKYYMWRKNIEQSEYKNIPILDILWHILLDNSSVSEDCGRIQNPQISLGKCIVALPSNTFTHCVLDTLDRPNKIKLDFIQVVFTATLI